MKCRLFITLIAIILPPATRATAQTTDWLGTYSIAWYSHHPVTHAPTISTLIVVLSDTSMPASMQRAVDARFLGADIVAHGKACWRQVSGESPMNTQRDILTISAWGILPGDTVSIGLWFHVDAGSNLKFWRDSTGIRGTAFSDGWMGNRGPDRITDTIRVKRTGDADPKKCLK